MKPREGAFPYFIESELKIYLKKQGRDGDQRKKSNAKLPEQSGNESIENLLMLNEFECNDPYLLYKCFSRHPPAKEDPEYPVYLAVLFVISNPPDIELRSHNQVEEAKLADLGAALREFTSQKLDLVFFPYIIKNKQPGFVVDAFAMLQVNKLMSQNMIECVANHPDPLEAARTINSLRNTDVPKDVLADILQAKSPFHAAEAYKQLVKLNMISSSTVVKSIITHVNPVAAADAYIQFKEAEIDRRLINDYLEQTLQTVCPDSAARGIVLLHKNECDSQVNINTLIAACRIMDNAGALIAMLKNKDVIESVLQHPQKDNLIKIFALLEKSKLLNASNIGILLDQQNAAMLNDKSFKTVWKHVDAPVTQAKFSQILSYMKKADAHKQAPHPVAGGIKLGFMRTGKARKSTDANENDKQNEPRNLKK